MCKVPAPQISWYENVAVRSVKSKLVADVLVLRLDVAIHLYSETHFKSNNLNFGFKLEGLSFLVVVTSGLRNEYPGHHFSTNILLAIIAGRQLSHNQRLGSVSSSSSNIIVLSDDTLT